MLPQHQIGTLTGTLAVLWQKGLRFGSVIDIGCADGHFGLLHWEMGMLRGARLLNVDARNLYVGSLERIRAAIGADYRICAVAERDGTMEMTQSVHPYWDSPRAADDPYWQRVGGLAGRAVTVPARSIDSLAAELALPGPFLLKLDIQGGELAALRGAAATLAATDVIVIEADVDEFGAIHEAISSAGFDLFDLVGLQRGSDASLGWFYPVYLARRNAAMRSRRLWDAGGDAAAVRAQFERRTQILKIIDESLGRLAVAATPGRPPDDT